MAALDTSVIIVAAGSSFRMNGENKQFADLGGIPVLGRTMLAFEHCESIIEIIVVTKEEDINTVNNVAQKNEITKLSHVVAGGNTRQESVICGLNVVSKDTKMIAVHDGARPIVSYTLIEKTIADARIFGGATLGVPVKDTIKVVNDGLIIDTPHRKTLYAVQTPQVFKKKIYFEGINFAKEHDLDFTDDCQLVESIGVKVYLTVGDYRNIKITTPEDILIARALLGE